VGLGLLNVVVVVVVQVGVGPVRLDPTFDGTDSTSAMHQGLSSVVQYIEDICSVVAVQIAVPQLAAEVVDNWDWDARQIHSTSEIHHC
jgi:hypothetical protein